MVRSLLLAMVTALTAAALAVGFAAAPVAAAPATGPVAASPATRDVKIRSSGVSIAPSTCAWPPPSDRPTRPMPVHRRRRTRR